MKKLMGRQSFRWWLALVGVATIIIGASYTLVQQLNRLSANDLPLATAQNAKHQLEAGAQPRDVVPDIKTNLDSDSTVFVTITDNAEHVLASSANLGGQAPLPPAGTFAAAKNNGSNSFTWQPQNNARQATIILPYGSAPDDGFIITGQSLKQVEDRVNKFTILALASWLLVLAWSTLILFWPFTAKKAAQ